MADQRVVGTTAEIEMERGDFFFFCNNDVRFSLCVPRLFHWVPTTSIQHRHQVALPTKA